MISQQDRDRILDMLGRLDGYPEPNYAKVEKITGVKRATLRKWVYRDRKRGVVERNSGTEGTDLAPVSMDDHDPRVPAVRVPALEALLEGATLQEAADAANVGRATVWRWTQEPGFKAALHERLAQIQQHAMIRAVAMREAAADGLMYHLRAPDQMDVGDLRSIFFAACDRTGLPKTEHQHITQGIEEALHDPVELARRIVDAYPRAVQLLRAHDEWDEEESRSVIDLEDLD
jgi:hypothetical protein